jgi:hypothetical protein
MLYETVASKKESNGVTNKATERSDEPESEDVEQNGLGHVDAYPTSATIKSVEFFPPFCQNVVS